MHTHFEDDTDRLRDVIANADHRTPETQVRLTDDLAAFWRSLRRRRSPRLIPAAAERIDLRRTLRHFVRRGGALTDVRFHEKVRERQLVVLFDCSESAMRAGLAVLIAALLKVDPRIRMLAFDADVFRLEPTDAGVLRVLALMRRRNQAIRQRGASWLTLADLDVILRAAARLAGGGGPRVYLLILSDLIVPREQAEDVEQRSRMLSGLKGYTKVWLLDTWPLGPGLTESDNGAVVGTAAALLAAARGRGALADDIEFREAETTRVARLTASQLARLRQLGDVAVLRGWRCTPLVRRLGFATGASATAAARLLFVPHARPRDVADILRELDAV